MTWYKNVTDLRYNTIGIMPDGDTDELVRGVTTELIKISMEEYWKVGILVHGDRAEEYRDAIEDLLEETGEQPGLFIKIVDESTLTSRNFDLMVVLGVGQLFRSAQALIQMSAPQWIAYIDDGLGEDDVRDPFMWFFQASDEAEDATAPSAELVARSLKYDNAADIEGGLRDIKGDPDADQVEL